MRFTVEDELCWTAPMKLESWAGYQSRRGPYGAVDSETPSDGSVNLVFAPEGRGFEMPNTAEVELTSWFGTHEPAVSDAVKAAILAWCTADNAANLRDFDFDASFPQVETQDDLRGLIGLHTVFVHQIQTGGAPYIGYEFGCEWDVEHDLGVLMHGTELVEVGQADTAFLLWIAKADWDKKTRRPAQPSPPPKTDSGRPSLSLTTDSAPPALRLSTPPRRPGS